MNKLIFGLFTILFCHVCISVSAKAIDSNTTLKSIQERYVPEIEWKVRSNETENSEAAVAIDPNEAIAYHNRAIANVKSGNYQQAVTDYTHAIAAIDRSNLDADESTIVINNARKASIYNARGLVKLKLGNKRGAIDDLTLAAELFDEVGLIDVSARSMRIVKSIDN
jgi:tetratricopeptide (TPR) repeat protein